jgi:hypothetical protein
MPGTFVFKPIEANLTHDTDLIGKMNPYCAFNVGNVRIKSQVCNKGGKHPHWNDCVTIPSSGEPTAVVDLMDKDKLTKDDTIGTFTIDLQEVQNRGSISKWYPLFYKNRPAGEILMEASFQAEGLGSQSYGAGSTGSYVAGSDYASGTAGYGTSNVAADYGTSTAGYGTSNTAMGLVAGGSLGTSVASEVFTGTTGVLEEKVIEQHTSAYQPGSKFYTEQSQIVTGQTFAKEVDVIETLPVQRQIETTVPQKVLKSVQVTEAVPVMKEVEVCEPVVVRKQIETMEPRLVTKTIQVVEDVPVMKDIDVVEMVSHIEKVETIEPQIVTRQVEVTEQVPVIQNVMTTEPITVKKLVEYEQPIITTKTITKELQQPVVVDQKITTEVGAATLVHGTERITTQFGNMSLAGQQTYSGQHAGFTSGANTTSATSGLIGSNAGAASDAFLRQEEGYTTGIQAPQYDTTYTNEPKKF